jgi:hypothetical protein
MEATGHFGKSTGQTLQSTTGTPGLVAPMNVLLRRYCFGYYLETNTRSANLPTTHEHCSVGFFGRAIRVESTSGGDVPARGDFLWPTWGVSSIAGSQRLREFWERQREWRGRGEG